MTPELSTDSLISLATNSEVVDDDLSLSAGKTLTADNISSSLDYVDFGAKTGSNYGYYLHQL